MRCPISEFAISTPGKVVFEDSDQAVSYSEADQRIRNLVSCLKQRGIERGLTVAMLSEFTPGESSLGALLLVFALQRIGAKFLILNQKLGVEDLRKQLELADAQLLVVEEAKAAPWTEFPHCLLSQLLDTAQNCVPDPSDEINLADIATILFTSGSTGLGKGVPLTVENHFASALESNQRTRLGPGDIWLLSLPLYHVGGLEILYRVTCSGAQCFLPKKITTEAVLESILTRSISHVSLVPTMLESMLASDEGQRAISKLKVILLGGAPASRNLLQQIVELNLPVLTSYGMTETTSHVTLTSLKDPIERVYSAGRPLKHAMVSIRAEDGTVAEPGTLGEVWLKGKTVCRGYLGGVGQERFTVDGWLKTGDIGQLDASGQLKLVGRKDDMIISGGENIHLREIEVAAELCPGVARCAVVPITHAKWGMRPILFVEVNAAHGECSVESIMSFLAQKLSKIKLPDRIIFLDSFPETGIGKIDYSVLRSKVAQNLAT